MSGVAGLGSHRAHGCSVGDGDTKNKEMMKTDRERQRGKRKRKGRRGVEVGLNVKYSKLGSRALE